MQLAPKKCQVHTHGHAVTVHITHNPDRARWPKRLESQFTDRKFRGSNPTSISRLPLSRLGQPGSISTLVQTSGSMAVRHRKDATANRAKHSRGSKRKVVSPHTDGKEIAVCLQIAQVPLIPFSPFRCLATMSHEGSTTAEIPSDCPILEKSSPDAKVGFEPQNYESLSWRWSRRAMRRAMQATSVRSILLYGSEIWPMRAEDVKRLSVCDHRYLRSIARIWWEHRISNSEVRRMVFGRNNSPSIDELITLHRLRWLGHVLRVRKSRTPRLAIEKLVDPETKRNYQKQLLECLPDGTVSDINGHWEKISNALLKAGASACGTTQPTSSKHWISDRTVSFVKTQRQIPPGRHHNSTRRIIRRRLKLSVRADREAWWTRKVEEMKDAKNAGIETVRDQNGSLICSKAERLDRWIQYFEQQFSWPPATPNQEIRPSTGRWTVNMEPPSVSEVSECISLLKRHRAAGPDDLPPALFKDGGGFLNQCLSSLFGFIWEKETVPDNWGESIVVPIFKEGTRSECSNHRGVSLTSVVTRLLASLILRRLMAAREVLTRENRAGFRPGRGCVDHIFTLRQVLEQRHMYRRSTILVFLDFQGAFDSVDRSVLLTTLARQGMPQKFVNIILSLQINASPSETNFLSSTA
ncbi:hypothetical protein T265_01386 [Opisthorchis viverrini]|uniref:Reverse transcriptase domain-containing protein n=1 Tax=Opisthorchis viverrini TaxID=6198 RepID=A0A074ZZJ5_OPIVI|nr:hypothetical protein T265_01386 [Opisthorchis viverrini]KER32506.1 hypothetical protein T265_01386 [Opisthorchis viverrini]